MKPDSFFHFLFRRLQAKSLQWEIIRGIMLAGMLSGLLSSFLFIGGLWGILPVPLSGNNGLLGMLLLSAGLFPALVGLCLGFPLSRHIKNKLLDIADAQQGLGRFNSQISIDSLQYGELKTIAEEMNQASQRSILQVQSLQRLVNENARLITNAEAIATSQERKKMARELHDAVSQHLFALSMTMTATKNLVRTRPEEAEKHFAQLESLVHLTQQELRALIMHLRPVKLEGISFTEGVDQLLNELQEKHPQIQFHWQISQCPPLAKGLEEHLFRIVQEAVSNVLRHAQASRLEIKLFQKEQLLLLFIEDNGIGFQTGQRKKASYGLSGMEERTSEIGGRFDIYSLPGKGTRIELRIPFNQDSFKEELA